MSIKGKYYHYSTGKGSKNRGEYYLCQNMTTNAADGCCLYPAWRDPDGNWLVFDARDNYVLLGLLEDNEMKPKKKKRRMMQESRNLTDV